MESWDGTTPIKVAYIPQTIDDTEWEYIYAYDSKGNEYQLDAQVPPDFPVLVVGINERTDKDGKITYHAKRSNGLSRMLTDPIEGGGGSGGDDGGSTEIGTVTAKRKVDKIDDFIGKNELINLSLPPLFSNRYHQPELNEMTPAGHARLTFWY